MIPNPGEGSRNVKLLNNTIINSRVCGLWIDSKSKAQVQGNIFWQGPLDSAGIRLHGPQGVTVDSALVTGSYYGMEINNGSDPKIVLSSIRENNFAGILAWNNTLPGPQLTLEHNYLWRNNLAPKPGWTGWTLNTVHDAGVSVRYCTFGPAGDNGLLGYGGTYCDAIYNYWSAANGPWPTGSGAKVEGINVSYSPYLLVSPVDNAVKKDLSLPAGGGLLWDSGLNVALNLTAKTDSTALIGEIGGVLRVNDTDHLNWVSPPPNLISGQIYVVWVSTALRWNSSTGLLEFNLPGQEGNVRLLRKNIDGSWTHVEGKWNRSTHVLTYSPVDIHLVNGTFALTSGNAASFVPSTNLLLLSPK